MTKNQGSRNGRAIIQIAIHTSEGPNPEEGLRIDPKAENLVAWMNTTTGASAVSYHVVVDTDSAPTMVPDNMTSWSIRNGNGYTLNLCFVGKASQSRAQWLSHDGMLRRGAAQVRVWCDRYGIPAVHLSVPQTRALAKGLIGHHDYTLATGDGSHTDPGDNFPWDVFTSYVRGGAAEGDDDMAVGFDGTFEDLYGHKNASILNTYKWNEKRIADLTAAVASLSKVVAQVAADVSFAHNSEAKDLAELKAAIAVLEASHAEDK